MQKLVKPKGDKCNKISKGPLTDLKCQDGILLGIKYKPGGKNLNQLT